MESVSDTSKQEKFEMYRSGRRWIVSFFVVVILPTKETLETNVDHVLCARHVRSFLDRKFLPLHQSLRQRLT